MPATYEPIATTTGSGSITFSSIPSTYTDLILVVKNSTASSGVNNSITVNGDNSSSYSSGQIYGATGGLGTLRTAGSSSWGGIGGADSVTIMQFFNYANTTTFKHWLGKGYGPGNYNTLDVSCWRNTAAINSISIGTGGASGTIFSLYGIKAA